MEIKVDLSAEQINGQICEAIAKSAIGEELQKAIEKEVKALSTSYRNPFENIIKSQINTFIQQIVREQYSEQIKELVRAQVTEKFTQDLFEKLWKSFENQY